MNKNNWKTILYIVITIAILGVVLRLLPYLLISGLVIWGIVKMYTIFNKKPNRDNNSKASTYNDKYKVEENIEEVNEIIDVDYKDV